MSKISELTDGGSLLPTDTLIAVRSGANVKVVNDTINVTTLNPDQINMGDNEQIRLGNSQDLLIYHDGTNSYIAEGGTGNLLIQAQNLSLEDSTGTRFFLGIQGGETRLYNQGNQKVAVNSTGINVTGTVTADGLTVDGGANLLTRTSSGAEIDVLEVRNNATAASTASAIKFVNSTAAGSNSGSTELVAVRTGTNTGDFKIRTSNSTGSMIDRLLVDSSGNVGIGGISPASNYSRVLHLHNTSTGSALHLTDGTSGSGANDGTDLLHYGTDTYITNRETTGNTRFFNGGSEAMRIDSSRNLLVGGTSYEQAGSIGFKGTGEYSSILSSGAGGEIYAGGAIALVSNGYQISVTTGNAQTYKWHNGTTRSMTLDSSGNLLVGKTSVTLNTEGHAITPTYARFTRDSANPVQFNRTTDDGDIATFHKDGTTVGSIGSSAGTHLSIGNGDTGLAFLASIDAISPYTMTGADGRDAAIDLGTTSRRFKDLYLSGGVSFDDNPTAVGGSVSSKTLDDYEEGTWTPAPNSGTLNAGATGSYVKIGNLVHIQGQLSFSANGTTNRINGLPFRPRIEATLNTVRQRFLVYGSTSNTAIYGYCQDVNNALFLQDEDRSVHNFDTADGVYTFAFTYET